MMKSSRILIFSALALFASGCSDVTGDNGGNGVILEHDPILFVHGIAGSSTSLALMRSRFMADGWTDNLELFAFTYSSTASNATSAAEIRDQINQIIATTGARKVDIIAHSMGSLSSRYYLKNLGGTDKVDAWVSLGGPNHGTTQATQCSFTPCQEMVIGSAFLTTLNLGDETPGPLVRYATWRTPCDELVQPATSVSLNGATNTQTPCISHGQLITDAAVYAEVKAFIE